MDVRRSAAARALGRFPSDAARPVADDVHEATTDEWTAHCAMLDRLAANRCAAAARGWTSLALERDGDGDRGRFRLVGVPPGGTLRTEVPEARDIG